MGRVRKRLERDTEVEQGGTPGTSVPVYHPSKKDGHGVLPESGTVERVFQGVPPHHNGSHETAGGDGAIVDERVFFWDEDSGGDPK